MMASVIMVAPSRTAPATARLPRFSGSEAPAAKLNSPARMSTAMSMLEVFELDAKGQPKQPALYSLDIDVTGLKTFKGTTKRAGGFPAGNYQVRITTDKFNEGDGKLRTAILVKDNFQLKNQEE